MPALDRVILPHAGRRARMRGAGGSGGEAAAWRTRLAAIGQDGNGELQLISHDGLLSTIIP